MTRPANLPAALQAWANANYGAGPPWAGTPQRAAPAGSALVPGVSLPAENENYLHGNAFDAAQGAINCVGQIPALNWSGAIAVGATIQAIGWSDIEQAWYAVQAASTSAFVSYDYGKTWAGRTLATASALDIGFDQAGNGVIIGASGGVQDAPYVTWNVSLTWTNHAAALASSVTKARVLYEPTNAKWCVIGSISATSISVFTSTNRSTWSASTIPATWSGATQQNFAKMGTGNGMLVAAFRDSSTTFRTMRSTDGGVTWTNDQAITVNAGITLPDVAGTVSNPAWSASDSLWYVSVNMTSTRKTQVFTSPDAITWTSAATLLATDIALIEVCTLGSLIIGLNTDGRVICSVNKGVNWLRCGYTGMNGTVMRAGGNGLMAQSSTTAATSSRFGLPATAA